MGPLTINQKEWIQDYYSPLLTVLAHDDVETIANKNNLTFTELLQPFSKMLTDVTIKDADGANHNVPALNIVLQDFKKDPHKQVKKHKCIAFEIATRSLKARSRAKVSSEPCCR